MDLCMILESLPFYERERERKRERERERGNKLDLPICPIYLDIKLKRTKRK